MNCVNEFLFCSISLFSGEMPLREVGSNTLQDWRQLAGILRGFMVEMLLAIEFMFLN